MCALPKMERMGLKLRNKIDGIWNETDLKRKQNGRHYEEINPKIKGTTILIETEIIRIQKYRNSLSELVD